MTRDEILNELIKRGYPASPVTTMKNNIECYGVSIGTGETRPCFYTDRLKDSNDLEGAVAEIIRMYEKTQAQALDIDSKKLLEWNYVKTRLQLCLQQQGEEPLVKREFLDLEEYVRVKVDNIGTFKVLPTHLAAFGVSEEELFETATRCTFPTIVEKSIYELITSLGSIPEFLQELPTDVNMRILTIPSQPYGAIALKNTELLGRLSDKYQKDLLILPSSIHEIIVVPLEDTLDISYFNSMVENINEQELSPEDVLSNHVYLFSNETKQFYFRTDFRMTK